MSSVRRWWWAAAALAWSTTAQASAVAGCTYTGDVVAVGADSADVTLRVWSAVAFGHSGAPAICAAVGESTTIARDAAAAKKLPVKVGEFVRAEVLDTWNPPAAHHHQETVEEVLPHPGGTPPAPPEPLTTVPERP